MRANDIAIHQKQKDEDVSYQLKVTVRQWTMSKTNTVKHVIKKKGPDKIQFNLKTINLTYGKTIKEK